PSSACCSGEARVTSLPSNTMRPVVGGMSPAIQLKKVDLPAPFGPIRPMISPSATMRSAPRTAKKPPNAFEIFSALSSMRTPGQAGRDSVPQLVHAARLESGQQHDHAAIENVGESRGPAAEEGVGGSLQRHENEGADQRSKERAGPAERGNDHHLYRDENTKPAFRINESGLDGIERAGNRGEGCAEHQRFELGPSYRHAKAAGGALSSLYCAQIIAETAAREVVGRVKHHPQDGKKDIIVGQLAAKG